MSQRKLTKHQSRRLTHKRQKSQAKNAPKTQTNALGQEQPGLVITSFGKQVLIEDNQGRLFSCAIRQHLGKLVAGDNVFWQPDREANKGVVTSLQPRSQEFNRPGFRGQKRMIAANIDFIGIVAPVVPGVHPDMIDRYLVAAKQLSIPVAIILNKTDLLKRDEDWEKIAEILEPYDTMGLDLIPVSAVTQEGVAELYDYMSGKNGVFVGSSGAGKSSLIQALIPDIEIRIGELSSATGMGKHTTSNSILYHLPVVSQSHQTPANQTSELNTQLIQAGNLIDSPGVRQFSPAACEIDELASYYEDFAPFLGQCKFNNCTHSNEPGCAIKQAVTDELIAFNRYQSFQRLREEFLQSSRASF